MRLREYLFGIGSAVVQRHCRGFFILFFLFYTVDNLNICVPCFYGYFLKLHLTTGL